MDEIGALGTANGSFQAWFVASGAGTHIASGPGVTADPPRTSKVQRDQTAQIEIVAVGALEPVTITGRPPLHALFDRRSYWRLMDLESYPPFVKLGRY